MRLFKSKNIWIYVLSFAASFVGIFLNFFLARVLQAENYGRLQYLVALATTISQILTFGLISYLIREAKNPQQGEMIFSKCLSLFFTICIFLLPVVYFIVYNYCSYTFDNSSLSFLVIFVAILIGINSLASAYFQGSGKYHLSLIYETLLPKTVLLLMGLGFFAFRNMDSFQEKYLVFYAIIYLITGLGFIIYLFKKFSLKFSKSDIKSICFFFGVTVTYSLGNNLAKVFQGTLYKNEVALAIISVSLSIVALIRVFTSVLDNLIKPFFAKKKRENDYEGLLDYYRFDTRLNSYVSIPMYLFFILFSEKFLVLFGESYLVYTNILVLISIANFVSDITGPNGTMLAMIGKEKWELFNGLFYFVTFFGCVFIFSFDSVYGICYSLLVASVLVNIAKYIETYAFFKKNPINLKTILSLLLVLGSNLGVLLLWRLLPEMYIGLWFALSIVLGVGLVVANTFLISLYRKEDFKKLLNLSL